MARILIVDDDEDLAHATSTVLKADGHETDVALDLKTARKKLAAKAPDLIVLDVMFPEDSTAGFAFAREIREKKNLAEIPILMLTAVNQKFPLGFGEKDRGEWMPVQAFVEKPVDLDVLRKKAAELLKG